MRPRVWFWLAGLALMVTPLNAQTTRKINFERDISPILERSCIECHHPGTASSNLQLKSREELLGTKQVLPGKPEQSFFYTSMVDGWMPPAGKLGQDELTLVRDWIRQGVSWPAGVTLKLPEKKVEAQIAPSAEFENVRRIRERISAKAASAKGAYKVTVPGTTISYDMLAIPPGAFTMGSDRGDEAPPHKVKLDAFWMQAHEVTWDEFRLFMFATQAGDIAHKDELVDGVSRPTRPYMEMSFGMGINGFPAISMTQHAANKYAEWLSTKTGEMYRLPTEAEWEYACQAGDSQPLADYAWYAANSNGKYQKVATKKPNAWGLFDMLGNAMEWTLDQYAPYQAGEQANPWVRPTKPYPIAVRGGSWNDRAELVRCSARVGSDAAWKQQDPQLPKSIWYETDAQWLGFRLVRPATLPSAEEMYRYWNSGVELDEP